MNRSRQQSRYVIGGGEIEALLVWVMGGSRHKEQMEYMIMLSVNAVIVVVKSAIPQPMHLSRLGISFMNIIMKIINIVNH